ncbi:uncharacterized protein LOC143247808 [Tachypleus tridentatus]|uniref:uncharacterized protein LOC143247808 n=1 Tax=Tachypleus tridentatus TaxID=6853 RepID=UPI003FD031C8
MFHLVVLSVVLVIVTAGDFHSYSQNLGSNELVPLVYPQKKELTYSISNSFIPSGSNKQHTSVSNDALGGHTINHDSHGQHINPYTGETDVEHSKHAFHINPYLGEAAAHSIDIAGQLNPLTASAAYDKNSYDAQIAPGYKGIQQEHTAASISPYGNHANHAVHSAHSAIVPEGVSYVAHTSQVDNANHPELGSYSKSHVSDVHELQGHGYGVSSHAFQNTRASYGPYGLSAEVKQDDYAADTAYNAYLNYLAENKNAHTHHSRRDPYHGYEQVTHTANSARAGPINPIYPSRYVGFTPFYYSSHDYA